MKILRNVFIGIILLVGAWVAVNFWPRALEPVLWTEADLTVPKAQGQNGYLLLLGFRDDPALKDLEMSDALSEALPLKPAAGGDDVVRYQSKLSELRTEIETFLQKNSEALREYRTLIDQPTFIDEDSLTPSGRDAPWMTLSDLQKAEGLSLLEEAWNGDRDQAFALWRKEFRMHRSWLSTSRKITNQSFAVLAIQNDLILLSYLSASAPIADGESVYQDLESFDPDQTILRRSLVGEYVYDVNAAESVIPELLEKRWPGYRLFFNRSLFRKSLNDRFRRLESLLNAHDMKTQAEKPKPGPFWWFYNPVGQTLERLLFVDIGSTLQTLMGKMDEIKELRSRLLAQKYPEKAPL